MDSERKTLLNLLISPNVPMITGWRQINTASTLVIPYMALLILVKKSIKKCVGGPWNFKTALQRKEKLFGSLHIGNWIVYLRNIQKKSKKERVGSLLVSMGINFCQRMKKQFFVGYWLGFIESKSQSLSNTFRKLHAWCLTQNMQLSEESGSMDFWKGMRISF